jgi:hypothetical protein
MADDELVGAYRAELGHRLPPDVFDELLDGLVETRNSLLERGLPPEHATAAAIVEFGRPDAVLAAFTRNAPGRRYAVRLLATGPVFALLWGAVLMTTSAWAWPVPRLLEIAYGAALLAVVGVLLGVLLAKNPAGTGRAAYAISGLIVLDLGMLAAVMFAAPALSWVMAPAIAASLLRLVILTPRLPSLLTHTRSPSGALQ